MQFNIFFKIKKDKDGLFVVPRDFLAPDPAEVKLQNLKRIKNVKTKTQRG